MPTIRKFIAENFPTVEGLIVKDTIKLDNLGKIGIRTLTPEYPLHVEGSGYFTEGIVVNPINSNSGWKYKIVVEEASPGVAVLMVIPISPQD